MVAMSAIECLEGKLDWSFGRGIVRPKDLSVTRRVHTSYTDGKTHVGYNDLMIAGFRVHVKMMFAVRLSNFIFCVVKL